MSDAMPKAASSVLVLVAHPDLRRSRVNAALADAVRGLRHITVHDLYGAYGTAYDTADGPRPGARFDVPRERALLGAHDTVVLQFPFYWYSTPPLLKQWLDEVVPYSRVYGGKSLRLAVTTGCAAHSYGPDGRTGFTMAELLRPLEAVARVTGMRLDTPYVVYGAGGLSDDALKLAAEGYAELLSAG
ncbi:NAD(P)H-dependent oxidoreductase [Streptomyces sp. NPDC004610]|uniref:NAD(P)H-dependent oxidoreductase n=1 Tax=unclassified Streptomyces TaxID=2593676 RepID=UPI0033AB3980